MDMTNTALSICDNCGEAHVSTQERDYGMAHCDVCHEAQLDYGFLHCPEAFECRVCGEQKRSVIADGHGPLCAECRSLSR